MHDHPPFYGKVIIPRQEQAYLQSLLRPFKGRKADESLQKEIFDALQKAKHEGILTIPFKVALRKDPFNKYPATVEVILDTKV